MLKILIIRNDKIGDFMLAWPSFALLKSQYPQAEITALVPNYTAALAEQCEWIDKILIDEKKPSFISDISNLSKNIRKNDYDLSISLFSETRTSLSLWLAGITLRIGPATKIAQIFLNKKLRQKRSQSAKPEYEYNLDLIRFYIKNSGNTVTELPPPPYLHFDKNEITQIENRIRQKRHINKNKKLVIIHPGSGGSAINLSTEQYAHLAHKLSKNAQVYIIISAGPDELSQAAALSALIKDTDHHIHESNNGLIYFCKYLSACYLFIGGSTGPLHIAGALDIKTVAFYPARRSATALRWKTLNTETHCLFFQPEKHINNSDMNQIDMEIASNEICRRFLN